MSRRSFRDRFFTPPVARAITSPSGILLAGAGASAAILAGLPIAAIAGLGAAAWAARVAVAVPRDATDAQHFLGMTYGNGGIGEQAEAHADILCGVMAGWANKRIGILDLALDDSIHRFDGTAGGEERDLIAPRP